MSAPPVRLRIAACALAAALTGSCATVPHPAYTNGQRLFEEGRYEQAIEELERAAKEQPRDYQYRTAAINARNAAAAVLLRQAAGERQAGRFSQAEALLRRALRIQPDDAQALAGLQQVAAERRFGAALDEAEAALAKNDLKAAEAKLRGVLVEAPNHPRAVALARQITERRPRPSLVPPALSAALRKPITLQFREANLRMILDAISRESGVSFVLDRDIRPDTRASILVTNAPVEEAIESLLATNQLAKKVVSDSSILVYPNTPQKARDYQDLVIRNFYLASADAKQMQTLLRTILKTRDIFIDEKRNLLVVRDTPEAIALTERLIAAHDQVEPEVMLDVEILEVGRAKQSNLGLKFPDTISLGIADPITLQALNNLDSGGVNVSGLKSLVTLNLQRLYSDVNLLANPRIRVRNKEKAKIHVGDRVPVISSSVSATTAITTQTVNYLDVGLKLEVEPQVLDNEVVIKINLEVSSLGKEVVVQNSVAYQIGTRNASTTLTLKDGETQVLAGLITDNERSSVNRVPGIGELPVLGRLFSSNRADTDKTEIVLSITPRLLRRLERPSADLAEYWSGPETNLRSSAGTTPSPPVVRPVPRPGAGGAAPPAGVAIPLPAQPAAAPGPGVVTSPATGAAATPAAPASPAPAPSPLAPPPAMIFQPPPGAGT